MYGIVEISISLYYFPASWIEELITAYLDGGAEEIERREERGRKLKNRVRRVEAGRRVRSGGSARRGVGYRIGGVIRCMKGLGIVRGRRVMGWPCGGNLRSRRVGWTRSGGRVGIYSRGIAIRIGSVRISRLRPRGLYSPRC